MQAIDLFCGCGGLSLGARNAGINTALSIDMDPILSSSYSENFPNSNLINADLSKLSPSDAAKHIPLRRIDAIIGGPPCQGFSVMGRQHENDPRNQLLFYFFDYVSYFQPAFFVMENVPGLGTTRNISTLRRAISNLPTRYQVLPATIMNAADFGAATVRPRLVLIGYDPSYVDPLCIGDIQIDEPGDVTTVREAISDLPSPKEARNWLKYRSSENLCEYALRLRALPRRELGAPEAIKALKNGIVSGFQSTKHTKEVISRFKKLREGERDMISKYPKLSWNKPAPVLRAGTGSDKGSFQAARPLHPVEPRVLSVREAARIQGFPDWFQFHQTKWHSHRMIGNSVSPIFAEHILKAIVKKMTKSESLIAAE